MALNYLIHFAVTDFLPKLRHGGLNVNWGYEVFVLHVKLLEYSKEFFLSEQSLYGYCSSKELGIVYFPVSSVV